MKNFLSNNVLLLFIIAISILLRVSFLDKFPATLHQDEAANTYLGSFYIKNGVDIYGNNFPIFYIDKWGDYPPSIPMFLSGIGTLFTKNIVIGSRIVIATIGALTVIPFFLLALYFIKNRYISYLVTILFTLLPYHIHLSRTNSEGVVALFAYLTMLVFIVNSKSFFLTTLFSILSMLTYPLYRLSTPLTLFLLLGKNKIHSNFKHLNIVFFITFLLLIYISFQPWGFARVNQTSYFSQSYLQDNLIRFNNTENNRYFNKIFNNKGIELIRGITKEVGNYISLDFLFFKEGYPKWFSIPRTGNLYFIIGIGLLLYVYVLIKKKETTKEPLLLLVATLLPLLLTHENFGHIHRALPFYSILIIIAGIGFNTLPKKYFSLKKPFTFIIVIITVGQCIWFLYNYTHILNAYNAIERSDGKKEIVEYINISAVNVDEILVFDSGWFSIYYLLFSNIYDKNLVGNFSNQTLNLPSYKNIKFYNQSDCSMSSYDNIIKNFTNKKIMIIQNSSCPIIKNTIGPNDVITTPFTPLGVYHIYTINL